MSKSIKIGERSVGGDAETFVVAELSGNHNGDLGRAIDTIHAAAEAGADAIKLQTYTADTLTINSDRPDFIVPGDSAWAGRTLYDLYDEAHTPWEWHPRLFAEARSVGLQIFSSPFDQAAVDLLEELEAPAHKIASFELVDDGLLRIAAETEKPILLSTGMASIEEVSHAVSVLRDAGCSQLILLHCTSSYPAPDDSMNLATIPLLHQVFECPVGLSDHSRGTAAPVVAVTLGACVIEKHFTLSRADGGVDSHFSLEPDELAALVRDVRRAKAMVGTVRFGPGIEEEGSTVFRRSLYTVEDIAEGERFSRKNVRSIRPGFGLPPRFLELVLDRRASAPICRGTPLGWTHING